MMTIIMILTQTVRASAMQLAFVKYDYFLSLLFIRVMHHFHILNFTNFV